VVLEIKQRALDEIFKHGLESYPFECCGLMIGYLKDGDRVVIDVIRAENVHEGDKRVRYRIDPMEYYKAEKQAEERGMQVVGIYHSHPNVAARPSQYDLENSFPNYTYLIISVSKDEIKEYRAWIREENTSFREEEIRIT